MIMKIYHVNYYLILAILWLGACKDDSINDEQVPVISIVSPELDKKVWQEVTVKAEVSDDQGIAKVVFYVGDELVQEVTEAPYEISLDTKAYQDGKYTVRCIAYDKANNQTETVKEIDVFNKLFKVQVKEGHLIDNDWLTVKGWIIVADTSGKVIQTQELINGSEVILERPDYFTEEKLQVSMLKVRMYSSGIEHYNISTYPDVSPDEWTLQGNSNEKRESIGTANFQFSMPEGNFTLNSGSGYRAGGGFGGDGNENFSRDLNVYSNPEKVYLGIFPYNEPPVYKFFNNVQPGNQYSIGFEEFIPLDLYKNISLPDNSSANVWIEGVPDINQAYKNTQAVYSGYYFDGTAELPVYIPASIFENYRYSIGFSTEGKSYYKVGSSITKMQESYQTPSVALEIKDVSGESLHAVSNHTTDLVQHNWSYSESSAPYRSIYWTIIVGGHEKEVSLKMHDIPENIRSEYDFINNSVEKVAYSGSTFSNIDDVDSYQEYLELLFKSKDPSAFMDYESIYVRAPASEGARISKKSIEEQKLFEKRFLEVMFK